MNDDDDDEDEDNEVDDARCIAWGLQLHHLLDDTIYAPTRKRRRPDNGSTISAFFSLWRYPLRDIPSHGSCCLVTIAMNFR